MGLLTVPKAPLRPSTYFLPLGGADGQGQSEWLLFQSSGTVTFLSLESLHKLLGDQIYVVPEPHGS